MKNKNSLLRAVAVGIALLFLAACNSEQGPNESLNPAVKAVKESMTVDVSVANARTGYLKGGTAVLIGDAAYYVQNGRVWAANGVAKSWSPGADYSPTGIDYSTIKDAVQ